ncbi:MAG TPA: aminopeptidase P family N-terminal domain-containing protein [Bryobacteraceae bacterium]|jgi:Xaa-Pro dipeptidase|nr:aminopeptidase P family N-terminal domain-containing protein [Bryobacteraceae bacterium]
MQQQTTDISAATYRERIAKLQDAMKEFGLGAVVLEPGPAMLYLTGVRWGKSERTFAVVLPAKGEPVWVLPGFEEMRARELIHVGDDIRVWQEDDSPYQRIVQGLKDRGVGVASGPSRVGIDDAARFFVFDGIRKLAPKLDYVGAQQVLKAAGVDTSQAPGRGRGGRKQ